MAEIPAIAERRRALARRHPVWRPQTLDRMLRRQAESFGGRPMVITDEGTWSYAEVVEMAERLARGLHAGGVGPGDRVAMVMANHAIFIPLALAVWRLGASLIPVNFAFQARELGYVIGQSACRTVVTMAAFRDLDYLAMLDELAPGWEGGAHDRFPELRQVITFGGGRTGVPTVDDILARGAAETAPLYDNPATPDDPAVIMYTSGTTGAPKGVLQSHDSLLRNGYATAMQRAFEDGRRMLFSLPLYHAFALVSGTISCFWAGGAIIPRLVFDPLDTLQACERHRATDILFVPTMAMAVVEHPDIGNYDLSSLFACQSAAAATPVRVWQQLAEGLGLPELVTGYGMTELSAATTMTEPDDPLLRLEQTVGRVMRGGAAGMPELGGLVAEYRTADPYSGEFLPDGAEGELVCRSPFATTGYFAKPAETEALFLPGGWLRSGDLGRLRQDGYLELTGRSKELYKSGGEMVAPKEVEELLAERPDVAQAYVIGLPDERWGEIGAAWVVPAPGAEPAADELIAWCRERLARFKQPRHVFFTEADDLPTTPTGKVQKFELIKRAQAILDA